MLEHIERLKAFHALELPEGIGSNIHQNRLLKMAREGEQMTPKNLGKFESERRYATLVALILEGTATATDEIIELHDHILMKLFSAAKNKHQQQFQNQGKEINDKVRLYSKIGHALLEAKRSGRNPTLPSRKLFHGTISHRVSLRPINLPNPSHSIIFTFC